MEIIKELKDNNFHYFITNHKINTMAANTKYWNYRVILDQDKSPDKNIFFSIREVYYERDIPKKVSSEPDKIVGEEVADLQFQLSKMLDAFKKPMLFGVVGKNFLAEVEFDKEKKEIKFL